MIYALILFVLWWVCWRPGMKDAYDEWRYIRAQRKKLDEIDVLEDLFRE
jgi:hypothetical protein